MAIPRPDLFDALGQAVEAAYEIQADAEFKQAMQGDEPHEIVVCLGQGRCLFPTAGHAQRECAFCTRMPNGFEARRNAKELARRMVMGN